MIILFPAHRNSKKTDTLFFFTTRREWWELTENFMEKFLWLSVKAVYLWRLLNSQAGVFTWLLLKRTGGIPLTTQVCLWFLTQGNKRKLTSETIWFYVYWYIKMNPFSNFPLQTGALQSQALFFYWYFNKKQATANGAQEGLSLAHTRVPWGTRCDLNLEQPRSGYEETVTFQLQIFYTGRRLFCN